jgi:hypothetical protein
MRLGFHEVVGAGTLAPLTISGAAILEAMQGTTGLAGIDSHKVRIETKVAGLMPAFLGADHTFGLKVEKTAGARPESAKLLTYDQTWDPGRSTKLGLNWQLSRQTHSAEHDFAPSLDFTWRSKF